MSNRNVLFIPGLGSEKVLRSQRKLIGLLNQLHRHRKYYFFFEPNWHTDESYDSKRKRLEEFYTEVGKPSTIFANSAGTSLAIFLTSSMPEVKKAEVVCGKLLGPGKIGPHYIQSSPALYDAVTWSEKIISSGSFLAVKLLVLSQHFVGMMEWSKE